MNALANSDVGNYVNKHFVSSFLKVGTFTVANGQKQGGNVASYFCTPEGQVLHAIAGPVNSDKFLREARWVVETWKLAEFETKGNLAKEREVFATAHAERLERDHGFDTRRMGRPAVTQTIAYYPQRTMPRPAPVPQGDGNFEDPMDRLTMTKMRILDRNQNQDNETRVHLLLLNFPMVKIESVYRYVFEKILNEKVSNLPVAQR